MSEVEHLRVPPHSTEAEQGVIGCVLQGNEQFDVVSAVLGAEQFYQPDYRAMWGTIERLIRGGKPADVLTVYDAGGHSLKELNALAQCVSSPRNARAYARIVADRWRERKVITVCDELASSAFQGGRDTTELIDKAISQLLALQQGALVSEPRLIAELLPGVIDQINERAEGITDAVPTGLHDVDKLTSGGMRAGELWVIGARPSMGKSAVSLTMSRNISANHAVLILTLEDSANSVVLRHIAAAGHVNLSHLRSPNKSSNTTWSGLANGVDALSLLRLYIDDQGSLALADVRRKIQQVMRRDAGLRVVVVDYLQLMAEEERDGNRNIALGRIANGLKAAAKEFGITIVLLSQLNREADKRNGVPQMADLRDSGDIEGAADVIGLLHREFRRKPEPHLKHWAQLHVAKHKSGPTDTISLWFDGETQRFADWDGSPVPRPGDEHGAH